MPKPSANSENGAAKRPNKSDAVRDMLAQHPKAKTKEIVTLLADQGVKVAAPLVYYVKSRLSRAQRKARRARGAEHARKAGLSNPVEVVQRVKSLANEMGGMRQLQQLVDLLLE